MSQKRKRAKEHPLGVAALQAGEFQYFTGREGSYPHHVPLNTPTPKRERQLQIHPNL